MRITLARETPQIPANLVAKEVDDTAEVGLRQDYSEVHNPAIKSPFCNTAASLTEKLP